MHLGQHGATGGELPNMIELPTCRWRGSEVTQGQVFCLSPRLMGCITVNHESCAQCQMCDHEDDRALHIEPQHLPARPAGYGPVPSPLTKGGVGTELKKLLARLRITADGGCGCEDHAADMDSRGVAWCGRNIDTIVGWLRDGAAKRGLPFVDVAGRLLVRRAIRNARQA